jgi:transcriptional regulator with XRE-family HTH domain
VALYNAALLASWREETGRTRERVCADITERGTARLGYMWLARLETDASSHPSLSVLTALADYYGHDVADLFAAEAAS